MHITDLEGSDQLSVCPEARCKRQSTAEHAEIAENYAIDHRSRFFGVLGG